MYPQRYIKLPIFKDILDFVYPQNKIQNQISGGQWLGMDNNDPLGGTSGQIIMPIIKDFCRSNKCTHNEDKKMRDSPP